MFRIAPAVLMCIALLSCNRVVHRKFTLCHDGKATGITQRVRLDGYYAREIGNAHSNALNGKTDILLLYPYGEFAHSWVVFDNREKVEAYLSGTPRKVLHGNYLLSWGRYRLSGDTIRAEYFVIKDQFVYDVSGSTYRIVNDTTIEILSSVCSYCHDDEVWKSGSYTFSPPERYCFVPFAAKPDSSSWLNNRKWYHCTPKSE